MNNKFFFPAIFHCAEEGGFWISFPDLPECLTQGENMSDGYSMAIEALGICLEERISQGTVPLPSEPKNIKLDSGDYLVAIEFDMLEYKKKTASQAVKKTLTIPSWLNEEAMAHGINFSSVLQDALKERLGLQYSNKYK